MTNQREETLFFEGQIFLISFCHCTMIAAEYPTAKLTQIGEPRKDGYYKGHVDVQVEIPGMATYKMTAVDPAKLWTFWSNAS